MFQFRWSLLVLLIVSSAFINAYSVSKNNNDSIFIFLNTSNEISWSKSLRNQLGLRGYKEYPIPNLSDLNTEYRIGNIYQLNLNSYQAISDQKEEIIQWLRFIRILVERTSAKAHVNLLVDAESKLLTQISDEFLKKSGSDSLYGIGKSGTEISFIEGQRSRSLDSLPSSSSVSRLTSKISRLDDWQYFRIQGKSPRKKVYRKVARRANTRAFSTNMRLSTMAQPQAMGLTVGGAMSVTNFRKKISSNAMPLPGDISFEGLFSDYYFDTEATQECKALFCPSYSTAVSPDPISGKKEYYLSVGLNSGLQAKDLKRKKLNLVVVLDISGSMTNRFGNARQLSDDDLLSKMELAKKSLILMTKHLKDEDRFGVVLFNHMAELAKPLSLVGETDMEAIRGHIKKIYANGGTNMEAGFKLGAELFGDTEKWDTSEYENRVIFLTDAMPNVGATGSGELTELISNYADKRIYTSFLGVGLDSNSGLINKLSHLKGANYHSVNSASEFKKVLADEFDYMVTPVVFNLKLAVESDDFQLEKVYGSATANIKTGEMLKISTLFPSKTSNGKTKGGMVLLKLKRVGDMANVKVKVSYEDREGNIKGDVQLVDLPEPSSSLYANKSIRKGILLSRYGSLLKHWIADRRSLPRSFRGNEKCSVEHGIITFEDNSNLYMSHYDLSVNPLYGSFFLYFQNYFEEEKGFINDKSLSRELSILSKLVKVSRKFNKLDNGS